MTEEVPPRRVARRVVAVLLVAICCAWLVPMVFRWPRSFVLSGPEDFDPTVLYLTVLLIVAGVRIFQTATAPPDSDADAGWLLAVAILAGAPALVVAIAGFGLPFLFALEYGKNAWALVLVLPVIAGPSLGVGISASYLLRADEPPRRRWTATVALILEVTAVVQLVLLSVTRGAVA